MSQRCAVRAANQASMLRRDSPYLLRKGTSDRAEGGRADPVHAATETYRTPLRESIIEGAAVVFILLSAGVTSCMIAAHLEGKLGIALNRDHTTVTYHSNAQTRARKKACRPPAIAIGSPPMQDG